ANRPGSLLHGPVGQLAQRSQDAAKEPAFAKICAPGRRVPAIERHIGIERRVGRIRRTRGALRRVAGERRQSPVGDTAVLGGLGGGGGLLGVSGGRGDKRRAL